MVSRVETAARLTGEGQCEVLHLIWSGEIGGIERTVEALVLESPRHRVLLLDGAGPIGDALAAAGRAERLSMRGGWHLSKLPPLVRVLRRLRPRVLHVQSHALVPLVVARLALPSATWVYQEQSPHILESDAKFRLLYALLRTAGACFVAPSEAVAVAMQSYLGRRAEISVVPNPCPVLLRARPRLDLARPPVVGVVARLEPQKRVDLLLEVVAELNRRGVACTGLVVGGGSLCESIETRRRELGLDDVVELAGSQRHVTSWLDRMDVFLATSASEPYGITTVEAMARGVPVVAMPCPGGMAEHVARGGLVLADRAVSTAVQSLTRLFCDDLMRRELQRRGTDLASKSPPAAVLQQLSDLYASL